MRKLLLVVCLVVMVLSGYDVAFAEEQQELIVSAAASLTNAMEEIGKVFEETTSISVTFNFASSGALFQQLAQGAPADVYASANQKFMNQAEEQQLILSEARHDFAENALVLAMPADAQPPVKGVEDLTTDEIQHIAIGDPASVPAGQYAKEALEGYAVWDQIVDKLVLGSTVRQVLDYLRRGEVEAGIVFSTDAALEKDTVTVVEELEHHALIRYPIAVTAATDKQEAALRFVEFVLSDPGQDILHQFGFTSVTAE